MVNANLPEGYMGGVMGMQGGADPDMRLFSGLLENTHWLYPVR